MKSVRPLSTKRASTSAQSFRSSHEIFAGASTSTGITWLTAPHWISTTAVPIPPERRQRSSRRWISAATSGSRDVTYVRGTMCVPLMVNLATRDVSQHVCVQPKERTYCLLASPEGRGVSSMRSADWRTLEGTRLSWRAWKPAQPRRVVCCDVKRRRSLAMFSSGYSALMGCCFVAATCAMVCWQIALCDGQCFFWHSGD